MAIKCLINLYEFNNMSFGITFEVKALDNSK